MLQLGPRKKLFSFHLRSKMEVLVAVMEERRFAKHICPGWNFKSMASFLSKHRNIKRGCVGGVRKKSINSSAQLDVDLLAFSHPWDTITDLFFQIPISLFIKKTRKINEFQRKASFPQTMIESFRNLIRFCLICAFDLQFFDPVTLFCHQMPKFWTKRSF